MTARPSTAYKLAILSALYFVQGLPAGFQVTALPVYLREQSMSRTAIALLGLLALPWSFKALWAPLVDTYWSPAIGRRRSWILPMQVALCVACVGAAMTPVPGSLMAFLGLVLQMNLFAATMDIAVDGLAVDLLDPGELGHGNSAQVVGYKVGMLTGGGLLVWLSGSGGWRVLLLSMAALVAAVLAVTLVWREPAERHMVPPDSEPTYRDPGLVERDAPNEGSLRQVMARLLEAMRQPGTAWVLLYIGTYKMGETLVDVMYKPFLVDLGYTPATLGLWLGTYGMAASLLGSLGGGWLASRVNVWTALLVTTALRVIPVAGEWWLASGGHPTEELVLAVTIAEHFFGGALTTAVFAFMMGQVDPRVGGSHYTLLATVEVLGKAPVGLVSGKLADTVGYGRLFALGTLLSGLVVLAVLPLRRVPVRPRPGATG